jgi:hypothetical protein
MMNRLLALLLISTLASSCGYFSDAPVENADTYNLSNLTSKCTIDPDQLALLLEEDIEAQIKCLQDNLETFAKYVKRERRDSINEQELGGFIRRFMGHHSDMILKGLGIIFEINMMILNDQRDRLSTDNIRPLMNLLVRSNKEAVVITQTFKELDNKNLSFWQARRVIQESFARLKDVVLTTMQGRESFWGDGASLDMREFINKICDQFEAFDLEGDTIEMSLAAKKLLVGGDSDIITFEELKRFIEKSDRIFTLAFDFYWASEEGLGSRQELFDFYIARVDEVQELLYNHGKETLILSHQTLLDAIAKYFPNSEDTLFYTKIATAARYHLLKKTDLESPYSFGDVRLSLVYLKVILAGFNFTESIDRLTKEAQLLSPIDQGPLRQQVISQSQSFAAQLKEMTAKEEFFPKSVQLLSFAHIFNEASSKLQFDPKIIDAAFDIKKLVTGGDRENLTWQELQRLLDRIPLAATLYFDFSSFNRKELQDHQAFKIYLDSLNNVKDILYTGDLYRPIIEMNDLMLLAEKLVGIKDMEKFSPTITLLKEKLLGGYADLFTVKDIQNALGMGQDLLEQLYAFDLLAQAHAKTLASPKSIFTLPAVSVPELDNAFDGARAKALKDQFAYVIRNFRYFRDEQGLSYYGRAIKRTRTGIVETAMINWFAIKVGKVFGQTGAQFRGGISLSLEQIDNALKGFKPVLAHFGLWSTKMDTFARNTLLLSDLFQSRSNGNMQLDAVEATEYGGLVLNAVTIGDKIMERLAYRCTNLGTKEAPAFDVLCYRRNFFAIWLNELGQSSHFPNLYRYMKAGPASTVLTFLRSVEGFARDIDDERVPMASRDINLLIGALLNIESTFVRFDANDNGSIEYAELLDAYTIYESAIQSVANLGEDEYKYTQTIFFFMVKEMKVPNKWDVMNWHYNPFIQFSGISAQRLNIGSLLYFLVNSGN